MGTRLNDVNAGRTQPGGLYEFIELIYHLASGVEPKDDELLRPLRWAIGEYKKSLPQSQ